MNIGAGAADMAAGTRDEDAGMEFAIVHAMVAGRNLGE